MEKSRYPVWFLGTVAGAIGALMMFNWAAGAYILNHPQGGSVQTLSGFERAIKPVWLAQVKPELVFVGSSRVRDGFDPVLVDAALQIPAVSTTALPACRPMKRAALCRTRWRSLR